MRLTEALAVIADSARLAGRPLPVISLPPHDLVSLSMVIEDDLGGRIYDYSVSRGFQYDGISFVPMRTKPRIRVKAGRRHLPAISPEVLAAFEGWVKEFRPFSDFPQ